MSKTLFALSVLSLVGCGQEIDDVDPVFHEVPVDPSMRITQSESVESFVALEDDAGEARGYAIYTKHGDDVLRHEVAILSTGTPFDSIDFRFEDAHVAVAPILSRADGDPPQAGHVENGWAIGGGGGAMGFSVDVRWTPSSSDWFTVRGTIQTPISEHSYTHSLTQDWYAVRDAAVNFHDFASTAYSWWRGTDSPMAYTQAFVHYMRRSTPQCQSSGGSSGGGSGSSGGCP